MDPEALQSFVKLMTEHQGAVRAFITSLMPGSPHIDDVLQETNVVLWQKRSRFDAGREFLPWAFTIARYEVLHQRNRTKRDGRLVFCDELVDRLGDTDSAGESKEGALIALDRCIAKLTEKQQSLIRERYTPGCTLEQFADRTGRSSVSLRVALHRVRQFLKRCVEETLKEETA